MEKITSVQNTLIKETKKLQQKKHRELQQKYLVEGVRLLEEALKTDVLESFFYDETLLKTARGNDLLQKILEYQVSVSHTNVHEVTEAVLKDLAETETPQGAVAVARQKHASLEGLRRDKADGLLLILDGLQDPGNLGTLLRTAWACGAKAVITLPGTAEAYNGKVVRATMGSIFYIPVVPDVSWEDVFNWCREEGYTLAAGDMAGEKLYTEVAYPPKTALVIGNEGQGLKNVRAEELDCRVRIPLANGVESLNAAVAGGILLYEIIRDKRLG
ncbi:MAG: RNA methyltransferase [Clostridia bacterium]|nr:RNA methyltransferase [Clostridia bacterium]